MSSVNDFLFVFCTELASRASSAWEKLKARARQQRSGSRTVPPAPTESKTASLGSSTGAQLQMLQTAVVEAGAGKMGAQVTEVGSLRTAASTISVDSGDTEDASGVGVRGLPITEDMSLADIRKFIHDMQLDTQVHKCFVWSSLCGRSSWFYCVLFLSAKLWFFLIHKMYRSKQLAQDEPKK